MSSDYAYGKRKELQVAEFLQRRGFSWGRASGSRGAVDLVAEKGSQYLAIQVKATRNLSISTTRLTPNEEAGLLDYTDGNSAIPTLALVSRNYVWFLRVPESEVIFEGVLKPLRYNYPYET
jgi:Holliday junction resolvase